MEQWTFRRYRRPRLSVDAIELEEGATTLTLRSGTRHYRLAFDDGAAARDVADALAELTDPDAPLWRVVRESESTDGWSAIATFLDEHSMIAEAATSARDRLRAQDAAIAEAVEGTASAVLAGVPADRRPALAAHAREAWGGFAPDAYDAALQPNFFLALLAVEHEYLRSASPLALDAATALLARMAAPASDATAPPSEVAGTYDQRDLESHLWLVGQCLVESVSDAAQRLPLPPVPALALSSGLEFLRQLELLTRDTLHLWGPNPYAVSESRSGSAAAPLVAGRHVEQYHVTRRFVEIVTPLLGKRLSPALRSMMFQYFSEEVGHEAFEAATCESLGVPQRALDAAVPLPLHYAFVDALVVAAEHDPVASFASMMLAEGVFGERSRLSPSIPDASRDHEALNDSLHHNSIARDTFAQIPAIAASRQEAVIHTTMFLLELNHRAWSAMAAYYGPQPTLTLPGRFGKPLEIRHGHHEDVGQEGLRHPDGPQASP